MAERDPIAEMRAYIGERLINRETAAETAVRIRRSILQDDPELYESYIAWVIDGALTDLVGSVIRSRRALVRQRRAVAVFDEIEERTQAAGDDVTPDQRRQIVRDARGWLDVQYSIRGGHRAKLADMSGAECQDVASTYQERASANYVEYRWLSLIAERVGERKVGEVFTEQQLMSLRLTIGTPPVV